MKNLYVFGNEYLEFDGFAKEIAKEIEDEACIVLCRSPDDLLDADDKEIIILDVVKEIEKPIIIEDISQLKTRNILSLHDFDVGFFLNLMNEMGMNKKIKIIGIPQKGNIKEVAEKVKIMVGQ